MNIPESEIEFNPFSHKGKISLRLVEKKLSERKIKDEVGLLRNEDYFLDTFFVEPFTRYTKGWTPDNVSKDDCDSHSDYEKLKQDRESLLTVIKDPGSRIIWLYGNAGCGKSTYAHWLAQQYKDSVSMFFCDFEEVKRCVVISTESETEAFCVENEELWNKYYCYRFAILLIDNTLENIGIRKESNKETVIIDTVELRSISDYYYNKVYDRERDKQSVRDFF
ncbi:MAG: hypothetical protein LBP75_01745 [Planctomycetota bacterium]|jgi:predicted AAA+ superfamily ATPase|nr:hypothetical protein [Planctomycetota bacterium]